MEKSTQEHGGTSGHRQRLRQRFLAGDAGARSDEGLLELLLTYAIPQRDVAPLAHALLTEFHDLPGVLAAEPAQLLSVAGVKENSAAMLKLVDHIRRHYAGDASDEPRERNVSSDRLSLFDVLETPIPEPDSAAMATPQKSQRAVKAAGTTRRGTDLFTTAFMRDAIEILPRLPDTGSTEEARAFLRNSLHYSAEQSRQRVAAYVMRRMFPSGTPDRAMGVFARQYAGRQEMRDVAFYRFCVAEPLTFALMEDLVLPAIGAGRLERNRIRAYLAEHFPTSKSTAKCGQAFIDAVGPAGIVKADKANIYFAYRDILLPSFAFVLHSEFPEPGMYDIAKLERNRAVRALLWNPDRILPALYELRNRGILSKVSEIDSVRQFTTRMTLDQAVEALAAEGSRV